MIITAGGIVIRTDVGKIWLLGRSTQGHRVMQPGEGDSVVAVATTNGKKMDAQSGNGEDEAEVGEEEEEIDDQNGDGNGDEVEVSEE
jgi:DNA gyrase subunit A